MKTKQIPFNLEMAKKIQLGEIKGRIVTTEGNNVKIICFDFYRQTGNYPREIVGVVTKIGAQNQKSDWCIEYSKDGYVYNKMSSSADDIHIELLEETPKHEFKPFDKVLVRNSDTQKWHPNFYATTDGQLFYTTDCKNWCMCIPYEGNEHLLGTTNKP